MVDNKYSINLFTSTGMVICIKVVSMITSTKSNSVTPDAMITKFWTSIIVCKRTRKVNNFCDCYKYACMKKLADA